MEESADYAATLNELASVAGRAYNAAKAPYLAPLRLNLREPHPKQLEIRNSPAKRKVVRAGRRGGKTVGVSQIAVKAFQAGHRILYATPTGDQIARFWFEVKRALQTDIDAKVLKVNETEHYIERPRTENRIRAKTAWNADTLRGDFADLLILDEYQLMNEDAWKVVGAPMLLDNNGDAVFVYTPPSIRVAGVMKAHDPMHAVKLFKAARAEEELAVLEGRPSRWATFHFSSLDNPHLSTEALTEITKDITRRVYEAEILALDKDDNPLALWTREMIDPFRVTAIPELQRIVVAIDPSATTEGDEAGIIAAGVGLCRCKGELEPHGFVLDDATIQGSPHTWASAAVALYSKLKADAMIAEQNNGGEMVRVTIGTVPDAPYVRLLNASRGKITRAEPIAAIYERGLVHHLGTFALLEDEMCQFDGHSGSDSPNRYDAMVWALTELLPAIKAGKPAMTPQERAEAYVNETITEDQAKESTYLRMSREMHLQSRLRQEQRGRYYGDGEAFNVDSGADEAYSAGGLLADELDGDPIFGDVTR